MSCSCSDNPVSVGLGEWEERDATDCIKLLIELTELFPIYLETVELALE